MTIGTGFLYATGNRQDTTQSSTGSTAAGRITATTRTISVLMSDSPVQPLKEWALAQQAILDKTNIRLAFQVVPASSFADRKNILLATNNLPEITPMSIQELSQHASTGIFLNVSQYVNTMPNFKQFWDSIPALRMGTVGGELYGFQVVQRNETANGFGPVIRTDLLRRHNLPTPTTFVQLLDVLEQLKRIYPDSRPYSLRNGASLQHFRTTAYMLGSGFDFSGGLYYDFDVDGGKYIFGPATQEFKVVLQFFADAYRRGVFDPDFAITTSQQFQARMTSGQSFYFNDNSGFSIDYTQLLQRAEPTAVLEAIPYLTNSFGQRRAIAYNTTTRPTFYALRADIRDPATVMRFLDWMYGKDGSDITNYGMEGTSFRYNAQREPEFIPEYVNRFLNQSPVYYAVFSDAGITQLNFALHAANTEASFAIRRLTGEWDDFTERYWAFAARENLPGTGALRQPVPVPPLSESDAERVRDITIRLSTYLEQEYNKYIMGTEPIANWDRVITEAVRLGARELEEIYNRANAPYK